MAIFRRLCAARILCVCLLTGGVEAARATEADIDALRTQVQALMDKINAQEKQLAELKTEQAALLGLLEKKTAPAAPVAAEAPPEKSWLADHLKVGGYGSWRFEANDIGGNNLIPGGSPNGFTFRRFVLTTDAKLTERLRIHTETEFERLHGIEVEKSATPSQGGLQLKQGVEGNSGGELSLEQAWGQFNFAEKHGVRAGIVLPPLGRFNILHDDDYWDLPRRTLVDRDAPVTPVKTAWRELGAGLVGAFDLGRSARLDYQVYVLNGATLDFNLESVAHTRFPGTPRLALEGEFGLFSGAFDGSQSARAVAWRTAFSPSLAGEFALSGYHGRYTPAWLNVSEPVNAFGFDYKWRHRALELEGEAIYSSFGRVDRALGAFAQVAYHDAAETLVPGELGSEIEIELGGLSRTRYGFWTDLKYNWRPQWLKRTFLGKPFEDPRLIPILRYERVWLNRSVQEFEFSGGEIESVSTADLSQDRTSLGLSYRPVSSFGVLFSYEHNRRLNGDTLIFPRVAVPSSNGFLTGMVFSF